MKFLSFVFVFFGMLFVLMGLYIQPMFPPFCMSILFFAIAGLFWRESNGYIVPIDNSKTPKETFEENKKMLEQIRKSKNK